MSTGQPYAGQPNDNISADGVVSKGSASKRTRLLRQPPFSFNARKLLGDRQEFSPLTMEKDQPSSVSDSDMGDERDKAVDLVKADGKDRGSGLIASLRRYPKAVFFMLSNEFCERFSFYGMRAILTLYLITEHHMSNSTASLVFHAFVGIAYFSPLFGSIAADNYFGRFKVILWVSVVYVLGHVLLSVGAIPGLAMGARSTLDFSGLFVIALATGGIKPCVSAFAADQFPEELHREREQFFSFFYFMINAGSLLAILVTPMLRGYVKCFGSEYCFPLAFGVPGVLMLAALLIFIAGWKTYKKPPAAKGNIVWKVCCCIAFATRKKLAATACGRKKVGAGDTKRHWLDYASPKFSASLIEGVKSMTSVMVLFLPVVLFWALFDQQGSTWIIQANRMNGRVGKLTILPDQMNIFNPLIVLICVPLFEGVIYPAIRRMNISLSPLRKMAVGGLLASLAFVIAGILQTEVDKTLEALPKSGHVFLHVFNDTNCTFSFTNNSGQPDWTKFELETSSLEFKNGAASCKLNSSPNISDDGRGYVLGLFSNKNNNQTNAEVFSYDIKKTGEGKTRVYIVADNDTMTFKNLRLYAFDENNRPNNIDNQPEIRTGNFLEIKPGVWGSSKYTLRIGTNCSEEIECEVVGTLNAEMGAAHVVSFSAKGDKVQSSPVRQIISENSVNLLWQLPQFLIITVGEVLFSVTGLEFSYSQAAPNMKSVLQAMWLMTVALGNMIDMGISGTHVIKDPAIEFFFYAALMFAVMLVFIFLAMRYTYVDPKALVSPNDSPQHELPPLSSANTNRLTSDGKVGNGSNGLVAD